MSRGNGLVAIAFTYGRQIGATLDRNAASGSLCRDARTILRLAASEAGVLDIPESSHRQKVAASSRKSS